MPTCVTEKQNFVKIKEKEKISKFAVGIFQIPKNTVAVAFQKS